MSACTDCLEPRRSGAGFYSIIIIRSKFTSNAVKGEGGAVNIEDSGYLVINTTQFINNRANNGGGSKVRNRMDRRKVTSCPKRGWQGPTA